MNFLGEKKERLKKFSFFSSLKYFLAYYILFFDNMQPFIVLMGWIGIYALIFGGNIHNTF